jgi:hypothetical protein
VLSTASVGNLKYLLLDTGFYEEDECDLMLDGNSKKKEKKGKNKDGLMYGAPFHYQVSILLGRTWRTIWREKVLLYFLVISQQINKSGI